MKIAISDFDGTLKDFNNGVPLSNIEAIHKWRKNGNKFGIATGRNLKMLDFDLKNYDITLDFVICVNGAVIANKNREILHSIKIPQATMIEFVNLPMVRDVNNPMIVFCERTVFSIRPYPEMPLELTPEISFEEVIERDDVVQFGIKFESVEEATSARMQLEKSFPILGGNQNRNFLDINMRGVNKKYGVEKLLEIMNWQNHEVLVIGDDKNDLPMIRHYNGFTVKTAAPEVITEAAKVYETVGALLLDNI